MSDATSLRFDVPPGETSGAMVDLISRTQRELFENGSPDFKACLAAGVPMVSSMERDPQTGAYVLTMRTEHPCGVVWQDGKATVYQQRASE